MVNADLELVKVFRINDYGCSGPNETSMSACPRLRGHPDRESGKSIKAGSGKSAVESCLLH